MNDSSWTLSSRLRTVLTCIPSFRLPALDRRWLVAALLCLGVATRLVQFLPERSLWHDEAALGANLVHRSFAELLQPLDFNQGAPLGFLMVEKIMAVWLGNYDWVLRLVPFLCGLASVFVFYRVALLYVGRREAVVALALFAIGRGLVYYSAELKQYSSDVLITLSLWWLAARVAAAADSHRLRWMLAWGAAGAAALWFSHAAVLVLAGTGSAYGLCCLLRRQWSHLGALALAVALWLGSFGVCHTLFLSQLGQNDYLLTFWNGQFMPLPPRSLQDLYWFPEACLSALEMPGGFMAQKVSLAAIALLALLVGCRVLVSDYPALLALLMPLAVTLAVSGLHKYPFADRLILFLVPPLLLLIAVGAIHIWDRTAPTFPLLGGLIVGLLFLAPVMAAAGKLAQPGQDQQMKPLLHYLQEHRPANEPLYVYTSAWPAFVFYGSDFGLAADDSVIRGTARGDTRSYIEDLDRLRGRGRVWLLMCHHGRVESLFRARLAQLATRVDAFETPGAAVYLFDFGSEAKP